MDGKGERRTIPDLLVHGERDRNEALYHLSRALVCGREDRRRALDAVTGDGEYEATGAKLKRRCLDLRSHDDAAALPVACAKRIWAQRAKSDALNPAGVRGH
jgi:hypothetical protein